jgi:hypothetical protein
MTRNQLYSKPPPGWNDAEPEIQFKSVSRSKPGDDKVFHKLLRLMKNISLPQEWENILKHYNDLNEKRNEECNEESKTIIDQWIQGKKLLKLVPNSSEHAPEEMHNAYLPIASKVSICITSIVIA